jgi:S-layer protein
MAVTTAQLQQIYLAYFGRPADFDGIAFYTASNMDIWQVAAAFSASPESQALYGAGFSPTVINNIYNNLFNRDAEPDGLLYWSQQVATGKLSAAGAALGILLGAQNADLTTVNNKLAVSATFTAHLDTTPEILAYRGDAAAAVARNFLKTVTSDAATVTTATANVDATIANIQNVGGVGQSFTLTTNVDAITGTSGNDTITGAIAGATTTTLGNLDKIDGAGGNDTLLINDTSGAGVFPTSATVSNVETIVWNSSAGAVVDLTTSSNVTGVKNLVIGQSSDTDTVTVGDGTAVSVTNSGAGKAVTVTATDSAVTVNAAGAVTVDGGSTQTVTTAGAVTLKNATGAITVTDKIGAAAIAIDDGTNVTVTATGNTGGTINIGDGTAGGTASPSGTITVSSTGAKTVAAANNTMGAIATKGGTTVSITEVATSDSTSVATDATGSTVTQGAVSVTGTKATTTVTVVQTAEATAVGFIKDVAGTQETQVVTFGKLTAGDAITVNGLTFTAATNLTAAQVASAFANLANGATQGSASASLGLYSGTFSTVAGSTGAVSGSTVTYTAKATGDIANIGVAVTNTSGTSGASSVTSSVDGTATVTGQAGVLGVVAGMVTVTDSGAKTIASVTLDGYGAGSTITSDALTQLGLANSVNDLTVTNAAATTLTLGLNGVGDTTTPTAAAIGLGTTYTTLNIFETTQDSAAAIAAGGVTALSVSGDHTVDLTGSAFGALKTVTVTGSAGVTLDVSGEAALTDFNASATSGNNTVTIDATAATYEGGSGTDKVTTSAGVTKTISLGAGDDTLTLAAGTTTLGALVDGGTGTDTLKMATADAVTASGTTAFMTNFTGFEKLSLTGTAADGTVNMANMNGINYVVENGIAAGVTLTLSKFAAAGTVEMTGATGAGGAVKVVLADATGTADSLNVVTKVSTADLDFGTVNAAGVESISLTATDTSTKAAINTATLNLVDAALKTVTITGNSNVVLTVDATTTALTSVDASALTGKLTAGTNGTKAETITGGSAADTLTANGNKDVLNGGAGADTLIAKGDLDTLTGGAGNDTFNVTDPTTNVNSYATITDLTAGDKILFTAAATDFVAAKVDLGDTAVFQDLANAAITSSTTGTVEWFQFGGNTYVIENVSGSTTSFQNNSDIIVKISGLVDLSTASFSDTAHTLAAV